MNETLYKVLGENGETVNGGHGKWSLPSGGKPGKWMPKIGGELIPCENGYHLCRRKDLINWLGPTIWGAGCRGDVFKAHDKIVVREARLLRQLENWNERTARLFACDCSEWALSLFAEPDPRSIQAIWVARLYAVGKATEIELDAAWAAARAAAWAAAGAAAGAARDAAGAAAWAAAGGASVAAGAAAAGPAPGAPAGAPGAAAGAAAWAAAGAAAGAAWAAARAAAWAARAAAVGYITDRLFQTLEGRAG